MPPPAEPKGPAMWEQVLKNPTVKSAINTGVREITRSIFGSGRAGGNNGYPPPSFL